jgi:LacI family transcriptional regulator
MPDKRVTIGDLARALDVSTSSVSRALSGKGYVSEEVRARVVETARKMGYVPDLAARNLRRRASTQLGLVISSLSDPFYARLASGFEAVARGRGYDTLLIIDRADPKEEQLAVESVIAMGVSGVAITPVSEAALGRLRTHGITALQIDRSVSRQHSLVAGDNLEGGVLATAHLLDKGHRNIAVLVDHTRWTTGRARVDGFREAFRERGLAFDESMIVELGDSREEIAAGIEAFMKTRRRRGVSAVFSANSIVSQLLYVHCQDNGVAIPGDMSLVAYDDVHWTSMVRPAVTVVSQHVDDLGRIAAETLIRKAEDPSDTAAMRTLVQPTLIERDSVASLPTG